MIRKLVVCSFALAFAIPEPARAAPKRDDGGAIQLPDDPNDPLPPEPPAPEPPPAPPRPPPVFGTGRDPACAPLPTPRRFATGFVASADYDGDTQVDAALVRADGTWLIDYARAPGFGAYDNVLPWVAQAPAISMPLPGYYDSDCSVDRGAKDVQGTWYIDYAANGFGLWDATFGGFGGPEYAPIPADYDGDGMTDLSTKDLAGTWYIDYSSNGYGDWDVYDHGFGGPEYAPVPADYDGDGRADRSTKDEAGTWYLDYSSNGFGDWDAFYHGFGGTEFVPVPADYDGDGQADFSTRDSWDHWYIDWSRNGRGEENWDAIYAGFAGLEYLPVPADYDGDGSTDLASHTSADLWLIDYARNGFGDWDQAWEGVIATPVIACPAEPPSDPAQCDGYPCLVEIASSASWATNPEALTEFRNALGRTNTSVRLSPGVELDFSGAPASFFPMYMGRCARLESASAPAPSSRGPLLRFGTDHAGAPKTFIEVLCYAQGARPDGARISGVRIYGPSFGHQDTGEIGIQITKCIDVEISNSEIAGWGGSAISVKDGAVDSVADVAPPEAGRILRPEQIRITRNYIHHNQHPTEGGHASGYGVVVGTGAWAAITENVFDYNRHAIAASHDAGGYDARRNLVLKGGGYHGSFWNGYTHQFDAHGDQSCDYIPFFEIADANCGNAGHEFWIVANAFQYRTDNAIKIRGRPRVLASISENVFPHPGLEDDWGDDAIALQTSEHIAIGSGNRIDFDSFGKYGVCDFDGDGIDDLFLATGATWWFSSFGEFPWSYLAARTERLDAVRLGYFDGDLRCDVLTESGGEWLISSGGTADWTSLGSFGAPLSEVAFGPFDPSVRDHRIGATRRATHAFQRMPDGQWAVTALSAANWEPVQSSSYPMSKLRFGDFTGDGVTDVLAVESGHWAISESARSPWRRLNSALGDEVAELVVANMDADDNIDDILRLERKTLYDTQYEAKVQLSWWRSRNGTGGWEVYKSFVFEFTKTPMAVTPYYGYAGRFSAALGGGVLAIDHNREGHFYSAAELVAGANPDFMSLFPY